MLTYIWMIINQFFLKIARITVTTKLYILLLVSVTLNFIQSYVEAWK